MAGHEHSARPVSIHGKIRGFALASTLVPTLLILAAITGAAQQTATGTAIYPPSPGAVADIPGDRLAVYQQAAARYGLDWAILAAIGKIECDHGRLQLPGCNPPGTTNSAGATGPMQFLAPTWRAGTRLGTVPPPGPPTTNDTAGYATDGDQDGIADVWNPADAVAGAARYLKASGGPADYPKAVYAYNHSPAYVAEVLRTADTYRGALQVAASQDGQATPVALAVIAWASAHDGHLGYSMDRADRGGTVTDMRSREPAGGYCDCSSCIRWAFANGAGLDVGGSTVTQWPANGLLPATETPQDTPSLARGVGSGPPTSGYHPGDLIFFGHGAGAGGHIAIYKGAGMIIHCSGGRGANTRPLNGYVTPTGWLRWRQISGN